MNDFKLYGKCQTCPKSGFFIRKRTIPLPIGRTATSQKLLCTSCYNNVIHMIKTNEIHHETAN